MNQHRPNAGSSQSTDRSAAADLVLVLGAPRSGTTWLAKILDSHPDVLYRHEPDEILPSPSPLRAEALPALLASWTADRSPRTVGKRPLFPKSFQSSAARSVRMALAAASSAAAKLPDPLRRLADLPIPDLVRRPPARIVLKSVRWANGAALFAETLPASRTIFILRHPCGQVASVMRGNRQRRFDLRTAGTDMPFDEAEAIRYAAAHGIDDVAFQALPDAGKYAWSWRAFNEPAYAALAPRGNVLVILYEALCATPETLARRILDFAGLDWNPQTASFLARSTTHQGQAGYYAIFRNAIAAAEGWRKAMPPADQAAVRSVLSASPLARFWPDLTEANGVSSW